MDQQGTNEGTYVASPSGYRFPLPTLLVRVNLYQTDIDTLLEGTLVEPVDAFDSDAIMGRRFETVIVAWSDYAAHEDSPLLEDTRRRLVDWINLTVCPRIRASRRPVWL